MYKNGKKCKVARLPLQRLKATFLDKQFFALVILIIFWVQSLRQTQRLPQVEPFSNCEPIVKDLVLPILGIVLASSISFKSAKKTPSNYLRFLLCCTFSFELRQKCGFYMSKTCLLLLNIGVRTSLRGDILHTFLLFFLQPFETR